MSEPDVITFGCRLNSFESEVIRRHARSAGIENVTIIHTCAVTAEAERQARQAVRKARKKNPHHQIIVTGCSAEADAERYRAMEEVDYVIGNHDKLDANVWKAVSLGKDIPLNDIMDIKETASHLIEGMDGRTRAFVQIQNGCDYRCNFCIIPYLRGPSRSITCDQVIMQIKKLVWEKGFKEIVLTGVDLTSWGKDLEGSPVLGDLVSSIINAIPDLPRLRLSSLDPAALDPLLQDLLCSESRIMPHCHLSVQAGSDMILKRMRRRHLRNDVIELTSSLRKKRPDIVFGADFIAGFPTETDQMFDDTVNLVTEAGLTYLHVFPYSPRPGTPAAKMPQVAPAIRKKRASQLRQMGEKALDRFLSREVGKRRSVLVERGQQGHSEHFAPVIIKDACEAGTLIMAELTGIEDSMLIGRVAQ